MKTRKNITRKQNNRIGVLRCLAICFAAFLVTGCINRSEGGERAAQTERESSPAAEKTFIRHSTGEITFDIESDWTQAEGTHMFFTKEKEQVYGLNGSSPLTSRTPQEFFDDLANYYEKEGQYHITEKTDSLSQWISSEGVACEYGTLYGKLDSALVYTTVLIAPQKNLVLTFEGQAEDKEGNEQALKDTLPQLYESVTFDVGSRDYISSNTFLSEDGSELCLQEDGSFRYYRTENDHESQYYEGTYEVFYGQPAFDKIASMTEYGLTAEELEQMLASNMNGYIPGGSSPMDTLYALDPDRKDDRTRYYVCRDTFYALILHNDKLVLSPEEEKEQGHDTLYIGYYIPELEIADLTNANTGSHFTWTYKGKSEKINAE